MWRRRGAPEWSARRSCLGLVLAWAFAWASTADGQGISRPGLPVAQAEDAVNVICKFEGGSREMHAPLLDGLRVEHPRLERYLVTRTEFGIEEVQFADIKKLVFIRPLKLDKDGYVKAMLTPREGKERKVDVLVKKEGRALVLVSPGTDAPNFRLVDCLELVFLYPP